MRIFIIALAVMVLAGCVDVYGNYHETKDVILGILQGAIIGIALYYLAEIKRILMNIDKNLAHLGQAINQIRDKQER